MQFHITLRGLHAATSPRTAGPFVFNEEHGAHLYGGRPMTAEEFNAFAAGREWGRLIDLHGGLLQIRAQAAAPRAKRSKKEEA